MTTWTSEELNKIGIAEEVQIASLRTDGTLRKWVIIWVVRLEDDLYIRCANGRAGAWFRGVLSCHEGSIRAGGIMKDVTFVDETDPGFNDQIDAAYLAKYRRYPQYVGPMVTPDARGATLRLVPRSAGS